MEGRGKTQAPTPTPTTAVGYYVEFILVEPGVWPDEATIAPPADLDKTGPKSGSSFTRVASGGSAGDGKAGADTNDAAPGGLGGALRRDVYASRQFGAPALWEGANHRAFQDVCLGVQKALARVEFPSFPEGRRGRTFREVYQLNAQVSAPSAATARTPRGP